jgi:hypothetical protein
MQQLAGLARRVWTIGEDLADTAGGTIGFARSLRGDRQAGGALQQAGLVAAAAVDGLLLATFRQLRAPSTDDSFAAPLAEASELIEYLDRQGIFAAPIPSGDRGGDASCRADSVRARDLPEPVPART